MTSKTQLKSTTASSLESYLYAECILETIKKESQAEFKQMDEAYDLLGWGDLPAELKFVIYDDVKFMVMELKGLYSSCDEFVQRRRDTVHFWVSAFRDDICDLETAVDNVKI